MKRNFVSVVLASGSLLCPILSSAFLFTLCGPASSDAFSVSIDADQSCFINRGAPDSTYDQTPLQLRNCSEKQGYSNTVTCPLIHFDLSELPEDILINSANMILTVSQDGDSGVAYEAVGVYRLLSEWSESIATWNNCPDHDSIAEEVIPRRDAGVNTPYAGEQVTVDITDLVQNWCDGAESNTGVFLAMTGGNEWGRYIFHSDDADANIRPFLQVNYSKRISVSLAQDSYIFMSSPYSAYGVESVLRLRDISGYAAYSNTVLEVLLKFALDELPFAAEVDAAELQMVVNNANGNQAALEIRRCESSWDEATVCWANRPQVSAEVYATFPSRAAPASASVDVYNITSLVQDWRSGVVSNNGLSVQFATNTQWGTLIYYSREWAAYAPIVTISYHLNSFDVTDYGAEGDGVTDDTAAIVAALAAADASSVPAEVFLPEGTYRISSTNDYALQMDGISDVCLKGEGSNTVLLVSNPENGGIGTANSTNILLADFTVDYDPLPFTQGTIIAVDVANGSFDLQIDPDYLELDQPCFSSTPYLWGITVDLATQTYGLYPYYASSWQNIGGRTWRMFVDDQSYLQTYPLSVGDRYVHQARQLSAVKFDFCTNVATEDITIHASAGLATIWVNCDGVAVRNCSVIKKEGEGRLLSSNGDGVHVSGCRSGVVIENCVFEGMSDDAVTIHGRGGVVIGNITDTVKKIGTPRKPTVYGIGDEIQVYQYQEPSGIVTNAVIVDAVQLNDVVWQVTLDRPLPALNASWGTGDRFYNLSRCGADSKIVDNYFGKHRGRDILLRSCNSEILKNSFHNQSGWAIALHHESDESTGPASYNVNIVSNLFFGVASGGITASIDITSFGDSTYDTTNVIVEGNIFTGIKNEAVKALCISGLILHDNVIFNDGSYERAVKPIIKLGDSKDISIDGLDVYDLHPETYAAVHIRNTASPEFESITITNLTTDMSDGSVDVLDERISVYFEEDGDFEGWTNLHNVENVSVSGGVLQGTTVTSDPFIYNDSQVINADGIQTVYVRLKADKTGTSQFYWKIGSSYYQRSLSYTTANIWQILAFDVGSHSAWGGLINYLRVDPVGAIGANFKIDWIVGSNGDLDHDGIADSIDGFNDTDYDGVEDFRDSDS